ncbi:hypothetical protein EMGBD3_02550 [Nitrosarchaeum sp.]|nr:hypothetical protein EMGBD3_02550 [Nitrosarchaeum sp.]
MRTQNGKNVCEQRKRNDLEQSTPNLESFLKNLDLKVLVKNANEFTIQEYRSSHKDKPIQSYDKTLPRI